MTEGIEYYDSEKLILEVEKRPILYDKDMKEYHDKSLREKLWREVCEAIIPNWAELGEAVKSGTGRDVQRKWKNIRDCFRKELNHQRRWKAGQAKRKRRKYVYYDQLLFLLPTIQERERKYESAQSSGEEAEENTEEATTTVEQSDNRDNTAYKPLLWSRKSRKHPVYSYEGTYTPIMQDNEVEEIDEDKYFLLSLLPSFRNLSPDQKFAVKIEFLQTLRNSMYSASRTTYSPTFREQPHTSFVPNKDGNTGDVPSTKQEADDFEVQ